MRNLLVGIGFAATMLVACGAAKWVEPDSWTLREDGRLRASQRQENFSFREWADKYQKNVKVPYGIVVTPEGAKELNAELSRRNAKIIELSNQLSECRHGN